MYALFRLFVWIRWRHIPNTTELCDRSKQFFGMKIFGKEKVIWNYSKNIFRTFIDQLLHRLILYIPLHKFPCGTKSNSVGKITSPLGQTFSLFNIILKTFRILFLGASFLKPFFSRFWIDMKWYEFAFS